MKILHFIDTLDIGGAERVAITLANIFASEGHEVGMLILLPGENPLLPLINNNVKIYLLNRKNKLKLAYTKQISSISKDYDIIHVHMRHNLRYFWYSSIFSSIGFNKIFFHDHFGNININQSIDFITKKIISRSIYVGVSKELCEWATSHCEIKNPYLLENFIQKENIVKKQRNKEGIQLLLVSNIHPRKNIEFAIEIIYELLQEGGYTLDIIGQITDNKYYSHLKNIIRTYGLDNIINFNEHCNNIQKILYKYDLALHTSKSEAGPLVLIEYLAQSLPFVAYSTGEVVQKIREKLPILIVDNFDIQHWIKQIHQLLNSNRTLIIKKMRTIYSDNYSTDIYYNRCLKIYQNNLP